jgi:hypothetical protein|tara:strand:+ start:393 stop:806 length:414 start_codon:yes stop_codon:yes gene_type:complete
MTRVLHKLKLDVVLPVEMEIADIIELFEKSFDVWLSDTYNGAVVGVDLHAPVAGHGWRERYSVNRDLMLNSSLDKWQKILDNYNGGSLTLGNVALLCGVTRTAVYHWINEKKIAGNKNTEGDWIINVQELDELAKKG